MLALLHNDNISPGKEWVFWKSDKMKFAGIDAMEGLLKLRETALPTALPKPEAYLPPFCGTKILCVGRNYASHAKELGNDPPKEPLWFMKPPSSLIGHGGAVKYPKEFGRIDYEGELGIVIGERCRNVPLEKAAGMIAGVTLALDITARELQKSDGQWTRAKGFDTFCPLGPFILPYSAIFLDVPLETELNGKIVQSDRTGSMIFPVPRLVSHISKVMTLEPGDVILTGTPAGVGPLMPGDRLKVSLREPLDFSLEVFIEA